MYFPFSSWIPDQFHLAGNRQEGAALSTLEFATIHLTQLIVSRILNTGKYVYTKYLMTNAHGNLIYSDLLNVPGVGFLKSVKSVCLSVCAFNWEHLYHVTVNCWQPDWASRSVLKMFCSEDSEKSQTVNNIMYNLNFHDWSLI